MSLRRQPYELELAELSGFGRPLFSASAEIFTVGGAVLLAAVAFADTTAVVLAAATAVVVGTTTAGGEAAAGAWVEGTTAGFASAGSSAVGKGACQTKERQGENNSGERVCWWKSCSLSSQPSANTEPWDEHRTAQARARERLAADTDRLKCT
jgi:hypothetical protein